MGAERLFARLDAGEESLRQIVALELHSVVLLCLGAHQTVFNLVEGVAVARGELDEAFGKVFAVG